MQNSLKKCKVLPLPDNIQALLVTNATNVYYITKFKQEIGERAYLVLVTHKKIHLLTSPLYAGQLKTKDFILHVASREKPYSALINEILTKEQISKLHFESTDLRYSEHLIFRKKIAAKLLPSYGIIEEMREIKTPTEKRYITIASNAALKLFSNIEKTFYSGMDRSRPVLMSEKSLKKICDEWLSAHPQFSYAFPPIIAADAHAAIPHYSGYTDTPIKKMVLIDWGLRYKSYNCDFTRVLFTPNAPKKMRDEYAYLKEILELLKKMACTGSSRPAASSMFAQCIDLLKKKKLDKAFLSAGHALGHGVGLDVHESPHIVDKNTQKIMKGVTIALEPAIYFPKKYGLRIEDTIIL